MKVKKNLTECMRRIFKILSIFYELWTSLVNKFLLHMHDMHSSNFTISKLIVKENLHKISSLI